jgi:Leucine-rich repeat (LRR) protein
MPNLEELHCSYTLITSLPDMPKLIILSFYNTQITSLPDMPNLKFLSCDFITLEEYIHYLTVRKALLTLASIQTLKLDSSLGKLKNTSFPL